MNDLRSKMDNQEVNQQTTTEASATKQTTKPDKEDYIEFEEVK